MSGIRHMTLGAVASAVASSVELAVQPCTVGYTPPEEGGGGGGGGPTSWTLTLGPSTYFFTDPGEEFGGPQVTESLNSWSSGIYWEFLDLYSNPILTLQTVGTGHSVGASVSDIDAFKTALGNALDTVDEGLIVSLFNDTFTVVFTVLPVISGNEVKYLHMASEVGNTAAFSTPASLVAV